MVDKDVFEYIGVGNRRLVTTVTTIIHLIPMYGPPVSAIIHLSHEAYSKFRASKVKELSKIVVDSFYHKEIEEIIEYVGV